jgi:hypothetical protein
MFGLAIEDATRAAAAEEGGRDDATRTPVGREFSLRFMRARTLRRPLSPSLARLKVARAIVNDRVADSRQ